MGKSMIGLTTLLVLVLGGRVQGAITLTFDSPVPGTIQDKNGLGTGFTHRLPLTGDALQTDDLNLELLLPTGLLAITSTRTHLHPSEGPGAPRVLEIVEAPGLFVPNVGNQDITISALFSNVRINEWSDQLQIYAGVSANSNVRAGFHGGLGGAPEYIVSNNQGSDWGDNPFNQAGSWSNGDDVRITLTRTDNLWKMSWHNLDNSDSGSSGAYPAPWLDGAEDLYVGVYYGSPRPGLLETSQIDEFFCEVIPEPSAVVLLTMSAVGLLPLAWRRRNRGSS